MGQALYRKYRSKSLSEVVGQEHITKTLEQALKSGRISHAYLFTGPRGTGKTSIARILAHEVNNLPYNDDSAHIDIIEIDAASNRRIDEIRELRERVYVAPTSAPYKVYIIDEVHMLTREAFNALLKTLEEPPAHVIFILATTDAHKLPETIISRTQRYAFKPAQPTAIKGLLQHIAKAEQIAISDEALDLLATHGDGSFRDSVSLLDQASSRGEAIDEQAVLALLGIPPAASLEHIVRLLREQGSARQLFQLLTNLYEQGYQAAMIAKQLGSLLREQLVARAAGLPPTQTLSLLRELIEIPASADPEQLLEIVLLQAADSAPAPAAPQLGPEPTPSSPAPNPKANTETPPKPSIKAAAPKHGQAPIDPEPVARKPEKATATAPLDVSLWPNVLSALKRKHNTLYSVARMAQPEFAEGKLKLLFSFPFHQKRLNEARNRQLLAETIEQIAGQQLIIECVVDKDARPYQAPVAAEQPAAPTPKTETQSGHNNLANISNIFGGGELLES